jgi:hypothetical protein
VILIQLGYQPFQEGSERPWYTHNHFHYRFTSGDENFPVELHWELRRPDSPVQMDMERIWARSVPARVAGIEVKALSPEDLLVYLCVHTAFHSTYHFYPLRSLVDIHETIGHYRNRIDWQDLKETALQWGAGNAVYLTLLLSRRLLGTDLPDEFSELAPARFEPRLLDWAQERFFIESRDPQDPIFRPMSGQIEQAWLFGPLTDKLSSLWAALFPNKQEIADMYSIVPSKKRVYFYYFVRWKDLLQRYSRRYMLMLRGDTEVRRWAEQENRRKALLKWLSCHPM